MSSPSPSSPSGNLLPSREDSSWPANLSQSPTSGILSQPTRSSKDPSQPLSGGPAMDAALDEIVSGNSSDRGLRFRTDPAAMLQKMMDDAQEQVVAAEKADAEKAAATGQAPGPRPDKRDRAASNGSRVAGKKTRTDQPAAESTVTVVDPRVIDMRHEATVKNRPTDFKKLVKPPKLLCAVSINGNEIMGNPFKPMKNWDLKVALEPGTLGLPSIGLDFQFYKQGGNPYKPEVENAFAARWEPGVKIGGQWMMQGIQMAQATAPSHPTFLPITFPTAIQKLWEECSPNERQLQSDKLVCAAFTSNVHRTTEMEMKWFKALGDDAAKAPLANLNEMYNGTQSYEIAIWFSHRNISLERFRASCLDPFVNAVTDHTPPLHQYLDENDRPFINFSLPSIDEIGNGMYRRYPKVKDATGRKVDDMSVRPTYINLPKTVTWDSIRTFHVTAGVPLVRTMQYNEGLHVGLERGWHGVHVQRMPEYSDDGKSIKPIPKWKHTFRAGIRLTRDPTTGLKDAIPPTNSKVELEFFNGDENGKEHKTVDDDMCFGYVSNYGGRAWLEKTNTDFCVLLTKPVRTRLHSLSNDRRREKLRQAKIRVKVNHEATNREVRALEKFCDETYAPELLNPIRLAFWSHPDQTPQAIDLTKGPAGKQSDANSEKYARLVNELKAKRPMNKSQLKVLNAASTMKSRIVTVQGPPGAGKTRTLRDKVIALTKVGHKVLCVASSNAAVDTDARAVWAGLSKEDRKTFKCLRLESDGAEKSQRLSRRGYGQYTGEEGEEDQMPEYHGPRQAQDNPAIRNSLDRLCLQFSTRQDYVKAKFAEYNDLNEAYQATRSYEELKQSNIEVGMTLDHHIWEITQSDAREAEKLYDETRSQLGQQEFDRRFNNGEVSLMQFNKSFRYKECIEKYIQKDGKVSVAEKTELRKETDQISQRVLADTDILFTTASNCGGELLEDGKSFVPTIIVCDEAGQISIPSLCVPLTTFTEWEGLFMLGDVKQLQPPTFAGQFNEFTQNAKVSPLALLTEKGLQPILLDEQYRMAPACSKFPCFQFYDGTGLKDSPQVQIDNQVRKAVRDYSKSLGLEGNDGNGSEYFVTNVIHGCSRIELNGTSLVNHANADVITNMVEKLLLTKVITASNLKILTYYQGQRRLLKKEVGKRRWPQAVKDAIEISTVDSFGGRESSVIIVDLVAAKDNFGKVLDHESEDEEDLGTEEYVKVGAVTGHVKNANRLNVALTRGRDATIIVCQAGLLSSTFKKNRSKLNNSLANVIGDAIDRKCLLNDSTEDSHPTSKNISAARGQEKAVLKQQAEQRWSNLGFISLVKDRWTKVKKQQPRSQDEPVKYYRVPGGHTKRPIGDPKLVAQADAFDEEQQLQVAKEASKAAEAVRVEDERLLKLGIQQSLDREGEATTSDQPTAMETDTHDEAQEEGPARLSESEPDDEAKEETKSVASAPEEFAHLAAGNSKDQLFADEARERRENNFGLDG